MIDSLCGNLKDYDAELYFYIKSRLESGIKLDLSFSHFLNEDLFNKPIMARDVFKANTQLNVVKMNGIRGLFPFPLEVIFPDDVLIVEKQSNHISLKLVDNFARLGREEKDLIKDPELYRDSVTERFFYSLKALDQKTIHIGQALSLISLGIISKSDFNLKERKTSKGFVSEKIDLKLEVERFVKNQAQAWCKQHDFVQAYRYLCRFTTTEKMHIKDMEARYISQLEYSKKFWEKDFFTYQDFLDEWMKI